MAVAMFMRWSGITKEQYDVARAQAPFERATAPGGLFYVAAVDDDEIHVTDVWESAADFRAYPTERLQPALAQLGFAGHPEVEIVPVHALIAPGFSRT